MAGLVTHQRRPGEKGSELACAALERQVLRSVVLLFIEVDKMGKTPMAEFKTFEEFWPYYLRAHSRPETRALHYAATTIIAGSFAAWLVTGKNRYLASSLLGITPASFAHFAIEHNRPLAVEHPVWSICADLLMLSKWLSGGLDDDLKRVGVEDNTKDSALIDGQVWAVSESRRSFFVPPAFLPQADSLAIRQGPLPICAPQCRNPESRFLSGLWC